MGTLTVSTAPPIAHIANLFLPIPPAAADGTIYTNDPAVEPAAVTPTQFGDICTGIANSTQLKRSPSKQTLASSLCAALKGKIQ